MIITKKMLNLAMRAALSGNPTREFYLGAIGIRRDGTVVKAPNGKVLIDDHAKKKAKSGFPPGHAEFRLASKLDKNSTVIVVRVKKGTGELGMARPCINCQQKLKFAGVKRIIYSIADGEFGVMFLKNKQWKQGRDL